MLKTINKEDLISGLVIAGIGLFFFLGALQYEVGSAANMGPGYLPMMVGGITTGLGFIILIGAFRGALPMPRLEFRPKLAVLTAITVFGLSFEATGLIPAVVLTSIIASLGDSDVRVLPMLILAVTVAIGSWLLFSIGLSLPFPAFEGLH